MLYIFSYETDAVYLDKVLLAEGLIEGDEGEYGLYVTVVDREIADYNAGGAHWTFYVGDGYAGLGVDAIPSPTGMSSPGSTPLAESKAGSPPGRSPCSVYWAA